MPLQSTALPTELSKEEMGVPERDTSFLRRGAQAGSHAHTGLGRVMQSELVSRASYLIQVQDRDSRQQSGRTVFTTGEPKLGTYSTLLEKGVRKRHFP